MQWPGWGMAVVAMADARAVSLSVQLTDRGSGVFAPFSDENAAQDPLICRPEWRQMPLSAGQLRTKTHHALALGHRHHRHPPPRPLHGLSLRYGGAIDGRIAALADH